MPGSNSAVDNLAFGLALAGNAQGHANEAFRLAEEAQTRAMHAEMEAASTVTDRTLQLRLEEAKNRELLATAAKEVIAKELKETQALLVEWMHSNDAFKRLAKKYRTKLGIDLDQHLKNLDEEIINISEEKPEYQNTKLLAEARASTNTGIPPTP